MQKTKVVQNAAIIVLAVAIIIMSVGYAAYSTDLKVTGNATITAANWDVHFGTPANISAPTGNTATPTVSKDSLTTTFDVTLNVGETYEFDVPVVNNGTFNAKLTTITLTGKKGTEALTIASGASTYTDTNIALETKFDGAALATGAALAKKSGTTATTKNLHVKVSALQPADEADLFTEDTTYTFTLTLHFAQAD